jgi:hypothetical protein
MARRVLSIIYPLSTDNMVNAIALLQEIFKHICVILLKSDEIVSSRPVDLEPATARRDDDNPQIAAFAI